MNYDENSATYKYEVQAKEIKRRDRLDNAEREKRDICERSLIKKSIRNVHALRLESDLLKKPPSVQLKIEQEEKLAQELSRQKRKEAVDLKMRQHLRENTEELRDLETKLRTAYITKALTAQIAEKEHLKAMEKMKERENHEILQRALMTNLEAERKEEEEEMRQKAEYKKELQDQMILKYQKKQNQYEEFLKEKKLLDDIIQQIHDEDEREIEEKMCRMRKSNEEIQAFKIAQDIWRQKEKKEIEAENRRIEEFLIEKEKREREKEAQKYVEDEKKNQLLNKLCQQVYAEQLKRKEREDIMLDLLEEEQREKEENRLKNDIKRQIALNEEMKHILARQLEEQHEKIRQNEMEDAKYKQQLMEKIIEDNKLEQMSQEKRRRKMIELRHDIEANMQERRALRAEELKKLMFLQQQAKKEAEDKRKLIEEERLRMLKEHASNLLGYLPPGLLRADDLPHLGSEVLQRYSSQK